MRPIFLALLIAAQAFTATASECRTRDMPPAAFDHEPTVPYTVSEWDADMLVAVCEVPEYRRDDLRGCAMDVGPTSDGKPFFWIYVRKGADDMDCSGRITQLLAE